jgi:hypothetical protein
MRYQVVVLDEEIGSDFTIEEISLQGHPAGDHSAEFSTVKIYMGLCASDQLESTFDDNYIDGTKTLVYEASSATFGAEADQWAVIALDDEYIYDSSQGNLIVEITWEYSINHHSFYVRSWDTGTIRAVGYTQAGAPSYPTGSLSSALPRLMLSGTAQGALETLTFGEVKSFAWE